MFEICCSAARVRFLSKLNSGATSVFQLVLVAGNLRPILESKFHEKNGQNKTRHSMSAISEKRFAQPPSAKFRQAKSEYSQRQREKVESCV